MLNRRDPDPFLAGTAWHVRDPLDVPAMQSAADHLVGEHDFSSFCRRRKVATDIAAPKLIRRIETLGWQGPDDDGLLEFTITAPAFCHQMVRSIVGMLVDVGRGRRSVDDVPAILEARERQAAGGPAPPHGLALWSVRYPDA